MRGCHTYMNRNDNDNKTKGGFNLSISVALIIFLLLLGLTIVFISQQSSRSNNTTQPSGGTYWSNNKQTEESTQEQRYIALPGFDSLTFFANKKTQEVNLSNPESNAVNMNMKIVLRDDTVVWHQDNITPGTQINTITPTAELSSGTYDAVLVIDCYLPDGTQVNGGLIKFTLNII